MEEKPPRKQWQRAHGRREAGVQKHNRKRRHHGGAEAKSEGETRSGPEEQQGRARKGISRTKADGEESGDGDENTDMHDEEAEVGDEIGEDEDSEGGDEDAEGEDEDEDGEDEDAEGDDEDG
ncbi:hypothetical protein B0H13DRAFT_1854913 [Mycena leptocephala]|nr:hypothetical protein B0H13DRAFT_1854913 [Mycena leptocephala]